MGIYAAEGTLFIGFSILVREGSSPRGEDCFSSDTIILFSAI
jgi:hypothetical protein